MIRATLRSVWNQPAVPNPPTRSRWDAMVVAVVLLAGATEAIIPELSWPALRFVAAILLAAALTRRRTTPLLTAIIVLTTTGVAGLALALSGHDGLLSALVAAPVALYSLVRWASGRHAAIGLLLAVPCAMLHAAIEAGSDPLGASVFWIVPPFVAHAIRSRAALLDQRLHQAKLDERRHIARELHDSVAHHVSGIAIQAKAARAVLASNPDAAEHAISIVEAEASQALTEMRALVGALRNDDASNFVPQQGVGNIAGLASADDEVPRVDVELIGDLDRLSPAVDAGVYRMAQECITNAHRHALDATVISVRVIGSGDNIELTVVDDGVASPTGNRPGGFGLVGMAERAALLHGTFSAGPLSERGWQAHAVVPKSSVARA